MARRPREELLAVILQKQSTARKQPPIPGQKSGEQRENQYPLLSTAETAAKSKPRQAQSEGLGKGHPESLQICSPMYWNLISMQHYWVWSLRRYGKAMKVGRMDGRHYYRTIFLLLEMVLNAPAVPHCPFAFLSCDTWTSQKPSLWARSSDQQKPLRLT